MISPSYQRSEDLDQIDENGDKLFKIEGLDMEQQFKRPPLGSVYGHNSIMFDEQQIKKRMESLLFDPKLSYHGNQARVFKILGGKKRVPDLAQGDFYDPVQFICSNAVAIDPIKQIFECKGH